MERTYEQQVKDWLNYMEEVEEMPCPGIIPSPPDPRDYSVDDIPVAISQLPSRHILPKPPMVLNQGQTPYCAGASGATIANAHFNQYNMMPPQGFSMTFLYWLSKQYDGIPNTNGTYIRTVLKIMHKYGCAPELLAPYSTSRINITEEAIEKASHFKIQAYARLRSLYDIKEALNKGMYIIMGTLVTRGNWSRPGGFLSYPMGDIYGGHGTTGFGYDDTLTKEHGGYLFGINSWGERWGDEGKFYLPYDYFNMVYQGRNKFMEGWAVQFPPIQTISPREEIEEEKKEEETRPNLDPRINRIIDRFVNPNVRLINRMFRGRTRIKG